MADLVFVLEDDADIARLVSYHLESSGYTVRSFPAATNFLAEVQAQRPSLVLLDIMVPGGDGLDVCRAIRRSAGISSTPIVFLTAKSSETDKVVGLELGADDYISKPFSPRELVARTKAVLRRFERPVPTSVTRFGDLEINGESMVLTVRGKAVETTATEFRLLEYLARHPGRVYSRDQLLDAVWRDTAFVTPRSVDVYIRRLREKIESDPENPVYLRTVRGMGYKMEAPK